MNLLGPLTAIKAAFSQQWKELTNASVVLGYIVGAIPTSIVIAWVALKSGNPNVMTYLIIGAPLAHVWRGSVLRVGWSLDEEMWFRTLEPSMICRTPLIMQFFGKAMANLVFGLPAAASALVSMLIVVRQFPAVADIPALIFSLLLVIISVVIISMLMAPLAILAGGRGGFFNAIMSTGVLISGFMVPIETLPLGFKIAARILPTSWAMDGVWKSITGYQDYGALLQAWGGCLLTAVLVAGIAYLMFQAVEKRIRIKGQYDTY